MGPNLIFSIKDVFHFAYDNSITESVTNLLKWLLGFVLIKLLKNRIYGGEFIVVRW